MPDFQVCRASMSKRGIYNGKQMCEAILKEHQVAVRISQILKNHTERKVNLLCSAFTRIGFFTSRGGIDGETVLCRF